MGFYYNGKLRLEKNITVRDYLNKNDRYLNDNIKNARDNIEEFLTKNKEQILEIKNEEGNNFKFGEILKNYEKITSTDTMVKMDFSSK
jgi:hypothetical protein